MDDKDFPPPPVDDLDDLDNLPALNFNNPIERRMAILDSLISAKTVYADVPPVKDWPQLILSLDRAIAEGTLPTPPVAEISRRTQPDKGKPTTSE